MKIRRLAPSHISGTAAAPGRGGLNDPTFFAEIAEMNVGRCSITETLVDSCRVAKTEAAAQSTDQLFTGRILLEVYVFLLNASPQPFDGHLKAIVNLN